MAQSTGPSIVARISLEGAQQVNQQLQQLGQTGQAAVNQIQNAVAATNSHWQTLGQHVERARAADAAIEEQLGGRVIAVKRLVGRLR